MSLKLHFLHPHLKFFLKIEVQFQIIRIFSRWNIGIPENGGQICQGNSHTTNPATRFKKKKFYLNILQIVFANLNVFYYSITNKYNLVLNSHFLWVCEITCGYDRDICNTLMTFNAWLIWFKSFSKSNESNRDLNQII